MRMSQISYFSHLSTWRCSSLFPDSIGGFKPKIELVVEKLWCNTILCQPALFLLYLIIQVSKLSDKHIFELLMTYTRLL